MRRCAEIVRSIAVVVLILPMAYGISESQEQSFDLVVAIGDSIIAGHPYHDPDPDYYGDCDNETCCMEYRLAELMGQDIINKGVGGSTTCDILARFETDVMQYDPELVIVQGGINDIARNSANFSKITDNLAAMYQRVSEEGGFVVAYNILPCGILNDSQEVLRAQVNEWIDTQDRDSIHVVDVAMGLADPVSPRYLLLSFDCGDHVHPSRSGYWEIANITYESVLSIIDERDNEPIGEDEWKMLVALVSVVIAIAIGASILLAIRIRRRKG